MENICKTLFNDILKNLKYMKNYVMLLDWKTYYFKDIDSPQIYL